MLLQMTEFPSFVSGWLIFYWYMFHAFLILSFIERHLGGLYTLAIVNRAAINIEAYITLQNDFLSFRYRSWSGITESYGSSFLISRGAFMLLFYSGCTNLHSHQSCPRVPFYSIAFVVPCYYLFIFGIRHSNKCKLPSLFIFK